MVSRLNGSAGSKPLGISTTRFYLLDAAHRRVPRPFVQPGFELIHRCRLPASTNLDAPVGEIDGMSCYTERDGHVPGADAEKDALNASADEKFTTHRLITATRSGGLVAVSVAVPQAIAAR